MLVTCVWWSVGLPRALVSVGVTWGQLVTLLDLSSELLNVRMYPDRLAALTELQSSSLTCFMLSIMGDLSPLG